MERICPGCRRTIKDTFSVQSVTLHGQRGTFLDTLSVCLIVSIPSGSSSAGSLTEARDSIPELLESSSVILGASFDTNFQISLLKSSGA
jgi:hypothetical protein